MVGFALSIAWAETTPERRDESSFATYIRWILFWPHFLIKRSETGARPEFWQLAREHPDIAYQWMPNDPETWLVVEPGSDKEAALAELGLDDPLMPDLFAGPFKLLVPRLGEQEVTIYGLKDADQLVDSYWNVKGSQQRFVERYRSHRRDE